MSAVLLGALVTSGCGQQINEVPLKATGSTLCFATYENCINPIFNNPINGQKGLVTCTGSSGCHLAPSGSGGQFKLDPNAQFDSPEMQQNFQTALSFVDLSDPSQSLLLLKPTATGRSQGVGHAGGNIFPSNTDACHVAIESWIKTQVNDENDPSCGICTAPSLATCGY